MTLKEIAQRAGVSISTVSRILNSEDDNFARKEVRDRVWAVVRETGYVPNASARALKMGKDIGDSGNVGKIACIMGRTKTTKDNPFFEQVSRAVEQQALSRGYIISHNYSVYDLSDEDIINQINTTDVDGAVIIGRLTADAYRFIAKTYKHIVYVGRNTIDADVDQVICDGYEATKDAVEYLIGRGHTRIGYIGETTRETRYKAYKDVLRAHAIKLNTDYVSNTKQDAPGGYNGAKKILRKRDGQQLPTAAFCATDISAIAAMQYMTEAGFKIPADIAILSMDDIEISSYMTPMLSTVSMPIVEMGATAVRVLIDRMNKVHKIPRKILLPYKLIPRETT
ncbi:MAG: LacI family transcriptional regulator [Clostridiales Family XIII bacterium]|jgi:DNA-binding LacI/PurR family transcriptional regulator|nr:LacI family transcriptional regulator [Clostridiales Family XIII bacterium]